MSNKNKEVLFPITWEKYDEVSDFISKYYDVEFLRKFGVIPKRLYHCIIIDYITGVIKVYDKDNKLIYRQEYLATPKK